MLALVPTEHKSLLLVRNAGAIALGGGEVIFVLLLVSEVTLELVVLSVIIVSLKADTGKRSNNNTKIFIMVALLFCHLLHVISDSFDVLVYTSETYVECVNTCFNCCGSNL